MKIIILGGGPTGLGAAWRLAELGHGNWTLYEKNNFWGGLSTSFQDDEGFWWDIGGHVLFSHYNYFDNIIDNLFETEEDWQIHTREAWIWMQNRFVPYPLQNNIHHLPKDIYWECLEGIIDIQQTSKKKPHHFGEWINQTFGTGLSKWFLSPYNYKVWAYPVEELAWSWVGERVAPVDLKKVLYDAVYDKMNVTWGPNATFRFPNYGGTGAIWRNIAKKLPQDKLKLNKQMSHLDIAAKVITFTDGTTEKYDALLSSIPVDDLVKNTRFDFGQENNSLKYSGTHIVGVGLQGKLPEKLSSKCWIYFPEDNCPFYRVTVFSNYSPNNVPDNDKQWSLMCEISESPHKKVRKDDIVSDVINGLLNTGLISSRKNVSHTWSHHVAKGYPTPSLQRDRHLFPLLESLEKTHKIYSRGRFGAWRYEVGNMDHSFMQGVECINSLLLDGEETTLWHPNIVNDIGPSGKKKVI